LLVLHAKNIPHEVINVNLQDKPEWLLERNPLGKVPAIEFAGGHDSKVRKILYESLIIADFLDDSYRAEGDRVLHSRCPFKKAKDRLLVDSVGPLGTCFFKIFKTKEDLQPIRENLVNCIRSLQAEIEKLSKKYIGGDNPGMADYMIWPWLERLPAVIGLSKLGDMKTYLKENFPRLEQYRQDMLEDAAVKAVAYSDELHYEYGLHHLKQGRGEI